MDNLNPRKFIILVIVLSVASSLLVSLLTIGLATGSRPDQIIERVGEAVLPETNNSNAVRPETISRDELVVSVVKKVSPAVVSVVASKDVPIVEQFFVDPFGGDPFFRQFFGGGGLGIPQFREKGTQKRDVSAGTGFVVSSDGLILTNKHVVADTAAEYTVFFNDGSKTAAKVLARDPVQDLAVLKVARTGLTTVALGDSSRVDIGETTIAIGNALGEFRNTVSVGVISGLHRSITASGGGSGGAEELAELIQTDAAINPGNSGGPLLNLRGEVIAINTAIAQGAENIGFAIPINSAKRDIESVKSHGRIIYPYIGVRYIAITKDLASQRKLPADHGALIGGDDQNPAVVPGSPADKAGLKSGDIILELNGARVDQQNSLATLLQKYKVGDSVQLKVQRGANTMNISATLEERK